MFQRTIGFRGHFRSVLVYILISLYPTKCQKSKTVITKLTSVHYPCNIIDFFFLFFFDETTVYPSRIYTVKLFIIYNT